MHDGGLTPVEDVLPFVLTAVRALAARDVALLEAAGLVLAEDVVADAALPRFDNSAMDGFAVRAVPVPAAPPHAPRRLSITGASFAGPSPTPATGRSEPAVEVGEAFVIATGARIPPGADAVVPVEDARREGDVVTVLREPEPGANIRRTGEDVEPGATVVPSGTLVGPGQVAAVAALGRRTVRAHPRPRVAVVPTGDEVLPAVAGGGGGVLARGQVFDAGGPAIAAAAADAGATVRLLAPAGDRPDALVTRLEAAAADADALITVGGVSVGERDVLRRAADALALRAWRLALQPAKPFGLGRVAGIPLFALPGNPASALVSFEVFVRPSLRVLRGLPADGRPTFRARLAEPYRQRPGRLHVVRARCWWDRGDLVACPERSQGAGMVGSLAVANAWLVLPPEVERLPAGAPVEAWPAWGGSFGPVGTG